VFRNSCCSASIKSIAAAGWRTEPYTARSEGSSALTLGGEIELDVANGWSERDICVAERVGGLRAIQNAQFGTAAEGF
jgi:hypothetical protein